jgi:hypothetical protein
MSERIAGQIRSDTLLRGTGKQDRRDLTDSTLLLQPSVITYLLMPSKSGGAVKSPTEPGEEYTSQSSSWRFGRVQTTHPLTGAAAAAVNCHKWQAVAGP